MSTTEDLLNMRGMMEDVGFIDMTDAETFINGSGRDLAKFIHAVLKHHMWKTRRLEVQDGVLLLTWQFHPIFPHGRAVWLRGEASYILAAAQPVGEVIRWAIKYPDYDIGEVTKAMQIREIGWRDISEIDEWTETPWAEFMSAFDEGMMLRFPD